jgi:SulP family sulfate permease
MPHTRLIPRLYLDLREGYSKSDLLADIVSLPLAMALAIARGVTPEQGLYTAIVAGLLISMLGGSKF